MLSRSRFAVLLSTVFIVGLAPSPGRTAPGAYADAGVTLYARFGALCSPAHPTVTTWRVGMYRDPGGGVYSGGPYAFTTGYYVSQEKVVSGKCVFAFDEHPESDAGRFTFANDLSGGELVGPSRWGTVHVIWSGATTQTPDAGPYADTPPAVNAGVYAYLDRPASASGGMGTLIHYPTTASLAYVYIGAEGGAYDG